MTKKAVFKRANTLQVVRLGTSSNKKIINDPKEVFVQTYTFSRKQFEHIANGRPEGTGMKVFFSMADSNCLDCPFNSFGKCYTHAYDQYIGFISMLKSIVKQYASWDDLPNYNPIIGKTVVDWSKDRYVRFGSYGEPSLHPEGMIESMSYVSYKWTGYTHQWKKNPTLGKYFMASTHSLYEEAIARAKNYRSFMVSEKSTGSTGQLTTCPASKEGGYKTTCNQCGLCSGTTGTKAVRSVEIINHAK